MRRLGSYIENQWMGALALFLVLASGTAYAANTVFSGDIVDGEVKSADLANGAVGSNKIADGSIASNKIKDNTLAGRDVLDDALKGADIDEASLLGVNAATFGKGAVCRTPNVQGLSPVVILTSPLCQSGPLALRAKCIQVDADIVQADLTLTTSQNDAFYGAVTVDPDFEVADSPATILTVQDKAATPESSAKVSNVVAGNEAGSGQIAGLAAVRVDAADSGTPCEFVFFGAG